MSSRKSLVSTPLRAFILVTTKPGTSQELVRSRRIKGVKIASSVFGRYDAVIVVEAEDFQHLNRIVYEVIAQHPNVVHTETLIAMFHPASPEAP
ncbi:MAG: Lrp/AsnC ligand binding domain-containing protein [Candidatus Bathyarchaeia archaeon]